MYRNTPSVPPSLLLLPGPDSLLASMLLQTCFPQVYISTLTTKYKFERIQLFIHQQHQLHQRQRLPDYKHHQTSRCHQTTHYRSQTKQSSTSTYQQSKSQTSTLNSFPRATLRSPNFLTTSLPTLQRIHLEPPHTAQSPRNRRPSPWNLLPLTTTLPSNRQMLQTLPPTR